MQDQRRVRRKFEDFLSGKDQPASAQHASTADTDIHFDSAVENRNMQPASASKDPLSASSATASIPAEGQTAHDVGFHDAFDTEPVIQPTKAAHYNPDTSSPSPQAASIPDQPTAVFTSLLEQALTAAVSAGHLPERQYAAPRVAPPSAKQRKQLPHNVRLTSPSALAVAAAAKQRAGASAIRPTLLATVLAEDISNR